MREDSLEEYRQPYYYDNQDTSDCYCQCLIFDKISSSMKVMMKNLNKDFLLKDKINLFFLYIFFS